MKIAVIRNYYRPEYGDVQSYQCQALAELGIDITLFASGRTPRQRKAPKKWQIKTNYTVKKLTPLITNNPVFFQGPIMPGLLFELLKGNFDLIESGTIFQFNSLVAVFAKKIKKIPLVISSDSYLYRGRSPLKKLNRKLQEKTLFKYILAQADHLISRHRQNRDYLQKISGKKILSKLALVPSGVDFEKFSPNKQSGRQQREKLKISKNSFIVLAVASLTPNKGIPEILKIMPAVVKKIPQAKFVLIGKGPLKEKVLAFSRKNSLHSHLLHQDYIEHHQLPPIYNMADVFLSPTHYEAAPAANTLIQAMACASPVVAADTADVRFYVKNFKSGILIKVGDTQALKRGIINIYQNKLLAKKLASQARLAVKELSWKTVAKKTLNIYQKAINKNRLS